MRSMIRIEHNSLSAGQTVEHRASLESAIDVAFDLVTSGCPVELFADNEPPFANGTFLATVWFDGGIDFTHEGRMLDLLTRS